MSVKVAVPALSGARAVPQLVEQPHRREESAKVQPIVLVAPVTVRVPSARLNVVLTA